MKTLLLLVAFAFAGICAGCHSSDPVVSAPGSAPEKQPPPAVAANPNIPPDVKTMIGGAASKMPTPK